MTAHGKKEKVEKGREVRIDCTVMESNVHEPKDSILLYDSVRVLTRMLGFVRESGVSVRFTDHCRRAKRRMLAVQYAKSQKNRTAAYRDLLKVAGKTVGYAAAAIPQAKRTGDLEAIAFCAGLQE